MLRLCDDHYHTLCSRAYKVDIVEEVDANVNSEGSGAGDGGVTRDRSVPREPSGPSVGSGPREPSGPSVGSVPREPSGPSVGSDSGAGDGGVTREEGVFGEGDETGASVPDNPDPLTEGQLNKVTVALDAFGMEMVRTPYHVVFTCNVQYNYCNISQRFPAKTPVLT